MPELRWILLISGLLFVGALAWWEWRRRRGAPVQPEEPTQQRFREPTLSLPDIRPREQAHALPVVEIDDDSMIGLRVDGMRIEEDIRAEEPPPAEPYDEDEGEKGEGADRSASVSEPDAPPDLIIDWPPEEQRKLLAVRVAARPGERFSGRALRLALTADGFVLGKFSIFHKPGAEGRVLVSAASIAQPGTFSLDTMDTQRYGGLGLFVVLPGPLPAQEMFDELLTAAHNLNDRLEGSLQDERGEPLTDTSADRLRESLNPEPQP